jgi:uncharacterized protein (TIGR03435 family)
MTKVPVALLLSVLVAVTALTAQQPPQMFEVASVKPNTDKVLVYSGVTTQPGGRLSAKATTLKDLVAYAHAVPLREVETTADWMTGERFDIEARGAENSTPTQFQAMLRTLLAERFSLRTSQTTKNVDAYALVVARSGIRLKPSEPGACVPPQPPCFGAATLVGRMMAPHVLISQIAMALSGIMDRPVVDQTGQAGRFVGLKLEWVPDESQYAGWGLGVWSKPVSDPNGPALATALQEQLGLRLESTKAPIDVVVIESATRPTTNWFVLCPAVSQTEAERPTPG